MFRCALINYWKASCVVNGVKNSTQLRASHIVPWARCESNEERLNVYNGLLLAAKLDAAFDACLLSFADDGIDGSVCLSRFRAFFKWISALLIPPVQISAATSGIILNSRKLSVAEQVFSRMGRHIRFTRMHEEVRNRLAWHRAHLFEDGD